MIILLQKPIKLDLRLYTKLKNHFQNNAEKWLITLCTGFALFFVLYIYQAYRIQTGLSASGHSLLFRAIVFGLFTSLSFALQEFYTCQWFRLQTFRQKIWWNAWEIFFGANVTFFWFNYFWEWDELYWYGYFLLIFEFTAVVIFPILIIRNLPFHKKEEDVKPELLNFISENNKHKLHIKPSNLLYIKAVDNYVEIYYLSDDQVNCELMRTSLKNIEQHFSTTPFINRCHRSYMVNPQKINQILSSGRHMQLDLGQSILIPVSKKYQASFVS